ncbi:MAG: YncE family protein, partial [Thermoplasmata archaeon]
MATRRGIPHSRPFETHRGGLPGIVLVLAILGSAGSGAFPLGHFQSNDAPSKISNDAVGLIATIPLDNRPGAITYDSGLGETFVTEYDSGGPLNGSVAVISDASNTVVTTRSVGSEPGGVAYDAGKGDVYVTDAYRNNVEVLSDSTDRVVATIPLGGITTPLGAAYDSGRGEIFVAESATNEVAAISDVSNTVVATVPVGTSPEYLTYDSGKGEVFVSNVYSNNLTIIS